MRYTLVVLVVIVLFAGCLLPVIFGILAWQAALRTIDASRDVADNNELVKRAELLLSSIKDVEVAQREFILTGDESLVARIADPVRFGRLQQDGKAIKAHERLGPVLGA